MATDRVGIEIEILGYQEAMNKMQNLERKMKGLQGIKARWDMQKRLKEVQQNATALRSELERLKAAMAGVARGSSEWNAYAERMAQVRREMGQTAAEAQRLRQILRNTSSVGQMFKKNTSSIAHLGSAFQSAGNALQRFLAPWRLLTGGALLGVGFSAITKIEDGLRSGFSRYDTMKKYPKIMKAFGYSAKEAKQSIDKLDKSVRGLPTGLDEMVDMAQRFTATTGDITKGTDLAIAANNAFLASMSTDTQRYQGMMQLQDVLGGKDMNAREWNSLVSSMTPAIVKMGESLGYTSKNMDEWIQKVRDGKVSNEDFIDTLIKVGTEGGEVAKMANESKDTWQAFSANVGNAFSRMSAGVLESLDEVVKVATGGKVKSLNMLFTETIIPGIDGMTKSLKRWIKAHPDEIVDFFNDLKSVDWAGLGKGFLNGLGDIAKAVQRAAQWLDGKNLEPLGKFFSQLLWLAPALTIGGGLLKGTRHIGGGILTGLKLLVGTLTGLKVGEATKNAGKLVGLLSKLGKAKEMSTALTVAGGAAGGVGAKAGAGAIAKGFLPAATVIGGIGGLVTEILTIATIDTWLIKKGVDNLTEITGGIQTIFDNVKGIKSTGFDADSLRQTMNSLFQMYDIIKGEQTGEKTRSAFGNKAAGFVNQRENGLGGMTGLKKMQDNMKALSSAFKSIGSIFTSLQSLQSSGIGEFDFSIMDSLQKLVDGVGEIATRLDSNANIKNPEAMNEKMNTLVGTITKIQTIASKLTSLGSGDLASADTGAFTAIENIKTMISHLGQAINTDTIAQISEQVATFKASVEDIFNTLNGDLEAVKVTVNIEGKVTGADELIGLIKAADSAIRSAVRGIQSSYTKHIYIHLQRHVNVTGDDPASADVGYPHTGGLIIPGGGTPIYRKIGGSIFKSKGTDTVPAMLTPGEYVHRKQAVDYFGVRFMQAINNLDIRGAMRALSARAGRNGTFARGTTIYNNITNNNQPTINQNIRTNNPNFAFKRSRYVTAL